jgi:hypothetical protein
MLRKHAREMVVAKFGARIQRPAKARRELKDADVRQVWIQNDCSGLRRVAPVPRLILTAKHGFSLENSHPFGKFVDSPLP